MLRRKPDVGQVLGAVEPAQVAVATIAQHRHNCVPRTERPRHLTTRVFQVFPGALCCVQFVQDIAEFEGQPQHRRALLASSSSWIHTP